MKRHKGKLLGESSWPEKALHCMIKTTETVTLSVITWGLVLGRLEWMKQGRYLGVVKLLFVTP